MSHPFPAQATIVREWWIQQRGNLDHYHLKVLFVSYQIRAGKG